MPTPLLIFSDAPSANTGLGRICRDIATIAHQSGDFKVATVGYGGCGDVSLPFYQYSWTHNNDWIIHDLPELWRNFAGEEKGIFLSIQDASRMLWFARPETCSDRRVAAFLMSKPFVKAGYFPIDATGPNNKLSVVLKETLLGYDRILAYTEWAANVVFNTLGAVESEKRKLTSLPHGIDTSVFYPRIRSLSRAEFGSMAVGREDLYIADDETLVGIVATNQPRKDFGQALRVYSELQRHRKCRLWIKTDVLDRNWSLPYLLTDFNINGAFISLDNLSDDTMAHLYSACDVTLGIGLGEGFGYPIFESIACGTPCVHGRYGGAPEFMQKQWTVPAFTYRIEGNFGCQRPVFVDSDWLHMINTALGQRNKAVLNPELNWSNLAPRWKSFLGGLATEAVHNVSQCASAS